MYGHHVHEAVAKAKDKESGITIHLVNEKFDEGRIIFQAKFQIKDGDDAQEIERQVRKLELKNYPEQIEKLILV
jgi:phosphoribosylglycinamide formyltransferase-1